MTNNLPYSDLFPYLHPLVQIDVEKYPIIKPVVSEFVVEHNYYLREYLDSLKLTKSTEFLLKQGLEKSIKDFDITKFKQKVGSLHIGNSKQECWVVWVFVAAAFILINRAVAEKTIAPYAADIRLCFRNAHDYKILWPERESRYRGVDKTNKIRQQRKVEDLQTIAEEVKKHNIGDREVFKNVKKTITTTKKRRPTFNKPSSFTRNDSKNAITQAIETKK